MKRRYRAGTVAQLDAPAGILRAPRSPLRGMLRLAAPWALGVILSAIAASFSAVIFAGLTAAPGKQTMLISEQLRNKK